MNSASQQIDFSTVLASAVHDMKNSLCLLLQSIESLSATISKQNPDAASELATLHYEASRVNTGLMQLLSLYKADYHQYPVNIEECYLVDLFDDLISMNENYVAQKGINLTIDYDKDLTWYLDRDLVGILLNDIVLNAMRYGQKKIHIQAKESHGFLYIIVEDDGPGYPDAMLEVSNVPMQEFDIQAGRTGLGLFFAKLIAGGHTDGNNFGTIHLENNGRLGGSVFTLKLP